MPLTETLAPTTWPFCSGTVDQTYGLPLKTATLDEATLSSVQHSEAYSSPGRPDHRTENGRPPTVHSHRRRSGVGSRGDTQQSLALEKIPVSHQVEGGMATNTILGSLPPKSLHQNSQQSSIANTPELRDMSDMQNSTISFTPSPLLRDVAILKRG